MVKQIIWSRRAKPTERKFLNTGIRDKSNIYSKKLNRLFKEAVRLISEYPEIGKHTDDKNTRIKIVRDYLIIYEDDQEYRLLILAIWDSR